MRACWSVPAVGWRPTRGPAMWLLGLQGRVPGLKREHPKEPDKMFYQHSRSSLVSAVGHPPAGTQGKGADSAPPGRGVQDRVVRKQEILW